MKISAAIAQMIPSKWQMRRSFFIPALAVCSSQALGLTQYSCDLEVGADEIKQVMLQYDEADSSSSVGNEYGQAYDAEIISFYEEEGGGRGSLKLNAIAIRMLQLTVFVEVNMSDNGSVYSVNHASGDAQNVHLVSMYPNPITSESDKFYLSSGFGNCVAL